MKLLIIIFINWNYLWLLDDHFSCIKLHMCEIRVSRKNSKLQNAIPVITYFLLVTAKRKKATQIQFKIHVTPFEHPHKHQNQIIYTFSLLVTTWPFPFHKKLKSNKMIPLFGCYMLPGSINCTMCSFFYNCYMSKSHPSYLSHF